jgi:serine/threonine-protein kinase RsbT
MTSLLEPQVVHIVEAADIVRARGEARRIAANAGFGIADQTRLATAVSELARNVLQHAGKGLCEITDLSSHEELAIEIMFQDHGAGIPDIAKAMRDGYSTNGGLGAGLPGTFRLMDKFDIQSQPGLTRITIAMVRRRLH